jgi:hypothetical protein
VRRFLLLFVCLWAVGSASGAAFADPASLPPVAHGHPQAGPTLSGWVLDALTGGAVPGAIVSASSGPSTSTTSDGSFGLVLPNGSVTITVTHVGFHPSAVTTVVHAGGAPLNVTLQPYVYPVHGAVVDPVGSVGIAGVVVVADPGNIVTTSGASGVYRLNLENGSYTLTVSAPGYRSSTVQVVVDGAPVSLYLFLAPPGPGSVAPPFSPVPIVASGLLAGIGAGALGEWSALGDRRRPVRGPSGPLAALPSWAGARTRSRRSR